MVLDSSIGKGSDSEIFQFAIFIVNVPSPSAGAECAKIAYSIMVRIAQTWVAPKLRRGNWMHLAIGHNVLLH